MKNPGAHVYTNTVMNTKLPKHIRVRGEGKPGQRFSKERLEALCDELGYDPCAVAILASQVEGENALKPRDKADVALKIMEYLLPKQRAVEHSGHLGLGLTELLEQADHEWSKRGR